MFIVLFILQIRILNEKVIAVIYIVMVLNNGRWQNVYLCSDKDSVDTFPPLLFTPKHNREEKA